MSGPSRFAIQPWSAMSKVTDGRNLPLVYVPIDMGPMTTGAVVGPAFAERLAVGTFAAGTLAAGTLAAGTPTSWGPASTITIESATAAAATPPTMTADRGTARGTLAFTSRDTAYTRIGSSIPFRCRRPRGMNPTVILACVMPFTVELTRTSPGRAAAHRRAAILTALPM